MCNGHVLGRLSSSSIFLPVVSGLAQSMGVHPLIYMIPTAHTCSLATKKNRQRAPKNRHWPLDSESLTLSLVC